MGVNLGSAYGKVIIDTSGVKSGTEAASKNVDSFGQSFGTLSKGIVAGVGLISAEVALMKKVFEFGAEGAKIKQMGLSFDGLLAATGAQADLLEQLRIASRGTIDDYSLMTSTATLLAGTEGELTTALANATPELLKMSEAAQKLNPSLGDSTFLYDSLAKGIKRGSPMILDNLGIIIKLEEAYANYAKSIGKSADELTSEQQKIALLNAVLAKGDVLMKQAGGSAEGLTDSYERMNTAVKNATDEFKAWASDGLAPAADGLYWLLTYQKQVNEALAKTQERIRVTSSSYEEYENRMYEALITAGKLDQRTVDMMKTYKDDVYLQDMSASMGVWTKEMWEAASATDVEQRRVDALNYTLKESAPVIDEEAAAIKRLKDEEERLNQAMSDLATFVAGPLREENATFIGQQDELVKKTDELQAKIDVLAKKKYLTKEQKEDLAGLKSDMDDLNQQYEDNATAHEERTKRILFDLLTERAALNGLTADELSALTSIAVQWGLMDTDTAAAVKNMDKVFTDLANGAGLNETVGKINSIKNDVFAIEGIHDVEIRVSQTGVAIPYIAGGKTNQPLQLASGGNFIVPPGYPDDNFMVGLTSGEHVVVTPKGKSTPPPNSPMEATSGDTYVTNYYLTGQYAYESQETLSSKLALLQLMER